MIAPGTRVRPKREISQGRESSEADGTIAIDGESLSPTAASSRVGGYGSGWDYWAVEIVGSLKTLATIRRELVHQLENEEHQRGSLA